MPANTRESEIASIIFSDTLRKGHDELVVDLYKGLQTDNTLAIISATLARYFGTKGTKDYRLDQLLVSSPEDVDPSEIATHLDTKIVTYLAMHPNEREVFVSNL